MLKLANIIDKINEIIGKTAAWATLFAVLFAVYNALTRKFPSKALEPFWQYSNQWVDAQWMLFSITFLFCAPWTLYINEHIRIDIVNERFSPKTRNWIDIIGHSLILIPFSLVMVYISFPWAMEALAVNEQSPQFGGLPYWPAKFLVPAAFLLLALQGISELIKRIYILRGLLEDPHLHKHSSQEIVASELLGKGDHDA